MSPLDPDDRIRSAAAAVDSAAKQMAAARRQLFTALDNTQVPRRAQAVCGTPSGYGAHRKASEPPCSACLVAHSWAEARATERRRARSTHPTDLQETP